MPSLGRKWHRSPQKAARRETSRCTGPNQPDHHIEVIAQQGRLAWQRITGYNLRNYAELAMQRHKRIFGNTMKARAGAAKDRGMDQCVCTEPNDQSRYAGVRESLESSEHRDALLDVFFIQQRPSFAPRDGPRHVVAPRSRFLPPLPDK
ncbi:hypothetical protein [Caballeronia mineralivorans]|uniref:hypothetical protein n=1 Tax=Caballeronia mineralivorans TaxID=2010198 RepID=UPI001F1729BB|nr:hypothetical protein [Caballeronia mineralivorans]